MMFWLIILILIIVLIAWIVAIYKLTEIRKMKGYSDGYGVMWFMGLFASPIVLGLYVIALPDKNLQEAASRGASPSIPSNSDLPSI